jgi:hypothetical protein
MAGLFGFLFGKKGRGPKGSLVFELDGNAASYNVTHTSGNNQVTQKPGVKGGFVYHYKANPGEYFYFAAQSNSPKTQVHVKVSKNRKVIKEDTKIGDYKIAIVSGTLQF